MNLTAGGIPFLTMMLFTGFTVAETAAQLPSRPAMKLPTQSGIAVLHFMVIATIATQFYYQILPPFRPYPFADDWIYALPLKFTSFSDWLSWAFTEHVDHRIPIQKLSNYLILRAAGFDFRYLVGFNYLLAIGVAVLLLDLARRYRGYLTAGDLIIPFAVLHFASGESLWGFQFQFISSIFFMALFMYLAIRQAYTSAAVALIACALCGMNGLLFATVGTVGMLLAGKRPWAFGVALLVDLVIWAAWHRTMATAVGGGNIGEYLFNLMPSSMSVFAFTHTAWKAAIVIVLFGWALVIAARLALRRSLTIEDYILAIGAVASFVVMLSVAVGRAKVQGPWNPGMAIHYGAMSVFLPVLSWLIISKRIPRRAAGAVGLVLAGVFFGAFFANRAWRIDQARFVSAHQVEIMDALRSGESAEAVAERYLKDFKIEGEPTSDVVTGIEAFRAAGARMYGG